jgi:hypothetical protein
MNAESSNLSIGSTRAGSNLRYNNSYQTNSQKGGSTSFSTNSGGSFTGFIFSASRNYSGAQGGGGSSVSGTWRKMSDCEIYMTTKGQESRFLHALWVRIS